MDIQDVELEKIYEFRPKAVLDPCGIRDITRQIKDNWSSAYEFSEDFDWGGDNLPKRILEDLGLTTRDIGSSGMGWLGGLCGALLLPEVNMRFRFSNNFKWENGEYGDAGSCMFHEGYKGPKILQHNKSWAIQFLGEDNRGIGRCLIAHSDGIHVLFNAYGLMYEGDKMAKSVSSTASRQDNKVSFVAALMNQFFGLDYKKVAFSINGSRNEPVFINGETGYLLGTWKEIRLSRSIDITMEVDIFPKCRRCGNWVEKDKLAQVEPALYGGYSALCLDCKALYETTCIVCGAWMLKQDPKTVHAADGMEFCSIGHASEMHYRKCSKCGDWNNSRSLVWNDTDKQWLCFKCFYKYYRSCKFCYKTIKEGDMESMDVEVQSKAIIRIWGCPTCISNLKLYGSAKGQKEEAEAEPVKRRKKVL